MCARSLHRTHAPGRMTVDRRVLHRKRGASAPARAATAGARRVWRAEAVQWGHLPWTAVVRPLCRFATPGLPRAAGRQRARRASACRRRSARRGGGRSEQDLATSLCGAYRQAALGRWSARAASSTATTGRRSAGSGTSPCAIMRGRPRGAAPGALACRQGRRFAQKLALLENLLRQAANRARAAAGPFLHVAHRRAVGDCRLRTRPGRRGCRDGDRDNDDKLIASVCSAGERRVLARLPVRERRRAFTELWTLKEAYSKLTGTGLATDFRSVAFQVETGRQVAERHTEHCLGDARLISWHAEAAGGLAQVSVAVDASDPMEDGGELVCCTASGPATRGSA